MGTGSRCELCETAFDYAGEHPDNCCACDLVRGLERQFEGVQWDDVRSVERAIFDAQEQLAHIRRKVQER